MNQGKIICCLALECREPLVMIMLQDKSMVQACIKCGFISSAFSGERWVKFLEENMPTHDGKMAVEIIGKL